MADFAELLDLIAQGIDPTTGEVVDIEELKRDKAFLDSVKRLSQKFCVNKEVRVKLKYEDLEKQYPGYVIVMKERFLYAAHNDSARVLNHVLGYKLTKDRNGKAYTGGPKAEKIADAMKRNHFSYMIVKKGIVIEKHKGRNAFAALNLCDAVNNATPGNRNKAASKKEEGRQSEVLKLRPYQIKQIEISEDRNITISELARRITVAKDSTQKGSVKYSHIANWLVEKGDLKEEKNDLDCMHRRPTAQGAAKGIKVETRQGKSGAYTVVVLDKRAQRYILKNLDEICSQ